jgi:putative endonuclease
MPHRRQRLGAYAEQIACTRLLEAGWEIIARNARTRYGEIDLIGVDRGALVFVEVKAARRGAQAGPERPAIAVGRQKQRRLRRLATGWLTDREAPRRFDRVRFDVIGVVVEAGGTIADYDHIEDAF